MTGVLPFGRSDLLPRDQIALGRKYQSQVAWKGRMASIGFLLNYTLLAHIVAATLQRQLVNDSEYGPAAGASPNCRVYKMVAKHCAEKPKHNRRDGADAPPKVGGGEPHAQLPSD